MYDECVCAPHWTAKSVALDIRNKHEIDLTDWLSWRRGQYQKQHECSFFSFGFVTAPIFSGLCDKLAKKCFLFCHLLSQHNHQQSVYYSSQLNTAAAHGDIWHFHTSDIIGLGGSRSKIKKYRCRNKSHLSSILLLHDPIKHPFPVVFFNYNSFYNCVVRSRWFLGEKVKENG